MGLLQLCYVFYRAYIIEFVWCLFYVRTMLYVGLFMCSDGVALVFCGCPIICIVCLIMFLLLSYGVLIER